MRHAFLELPIDEFHEVQRLYELDDKTEFDARMAAYMVEHTPVAAIRSMLAEHHLLALRRDVVLATSFLQGLMPPTGSRGEGRPECAPRQQLRWDVCLHFWLSRWVLADVVLGAGAPH